LGADALPARIAIVPVSPSAAGQLAHDGLAAGAVVRAEEAEAAALRGVAVEAHDLAAELDGLVDGRGQRVRVAARDRDARHARARELLDGLRLLLRVLLGRRLPVDLDLQAARGPQLARRGERAGVRGLEDRIALALGDEPDRDRARRGARRRAAGRARRGRLLAAARREARERGGHRERQAGSAGRSAGHAAHHATCCPHPRGGGAVHDHRAGCVLRRRRFRRPLCQGPHARGGPALVQPAQAGR
jgi:hypothetical protein